MATIPTYQRQISAAVENLPGARASGSVSAADPIGNAMQNIGQQGVSIAGQMMQEQKQQAENQASVTVSNVLSQRQIYDQEDFTRRAQAWKVGDPDLRESIGKDYDKWIETEAAKLPTDASRRYFQQHAENMKVRQVTSAFSYQEKATTAKLNADTEVGIQADQNVVAKDPTQYKQVYARRMEAMLARTDLTEAQKIETAQKYKAGLNFAVESGQLERDPAGWYKQRYGEYKRPATSTAAGSVSPGGAAGFDSAVAQVFVHEGGYSASDGNTGAPVNFGINQKANPDIDVKNLTKEGAAKIYKERYWDKIKGDTLPAALQGTAMDAAVNQGPVLANRWIQESGGDPAKFNALRREHYERLLEEPKNQKFRKAWLGRLASYENQSGAVTAQPVASVTVAANGGPDVVTGGSNPEPVQQPDTFAGMDWDTQLKLKNQAEARIRQTEAALHAEMDQKVRDATAMHTDGKSDPFNMTAEDFARAYGAQGGAKFAEYQASRAMGSDIGQFKTMTPDEINASLTKSKEDVDKLAATGGTGYQTADARQNVRMQAAKHVVEMQQKDPQSYAVQAGLSNAKPLDFSNMDAFGKEIGSRAGIAAMMRDKYKAPYTLLTNTEAAQFSQVMSKFPAAARVDYLNTIRRSVADPVAYRAVIAQIAPDSPVTAVAGSILGKDEAMVVKGGIFSSDVTMSPKAVATTILQGESILNPNKGDKKQDGRGGDFPMPKNTDMEREFENYAGKAFRGDAAGYSAAFQAYRAYYAGKASEKGVLSSDLDGKLSKEALNAVTGGVHDFNGNGEVIKPWGMSDDEFKSRVNSKMAIAMDANGYKGTRMDNPSAYGLQQLRDSQYLVTNGTTYLLGKDGQPIVIDTRPTTGAAQIPQTRVNSREVTGKVQ